MANNIEIGSPTRTRAIMEAYGLHFKKSLGQNFLTDINILRKIVTSAEITTADDVIEIGPGIGALTEQLAQNAHQVLALEIDQRLIPVLGETLAPYDNVTVVNQDVLQADLSQLVATHFTGDRPLKVVANLPYYITTKIIMNLLDSGVALDKIVIMVQKEVADRLAATPQTKDYSSLSVAVQYAMDVQTAFIVPKTVFVPQPKVDSAIAVLTRKTEARVQPQDESHFRTLVKGSFMHRRKSLWNNLQGLYGKDADVKAKMQTALTKAEIVPSVRAEALTVEDFIRLSDCLLAAGVIAK